MVHAPALYGREPLQYGNSHHAVLHWRCVRAKREQIEVHPEVCLV